MDSILPDILFTLFDVLFLLFCGVLVLIVFLTVIIHGFENIVFKNKYLILFYSRSTYILGIPIIGIKKYKSINRAVKELLKFPQYLERRKPDLKILFKYAINIHLVIGAIFLSIIGIIYPQISSIALILQIITSIILIIDYKYILKFRRLH